MNMIEKVARAIGSWPQRTCNCDDCARYMITQKQVAIFQARAVIEVMREPTDEMIEILAGSIGSYEEARLVYKAMTDAALKE